MLSRSRAFRIAFRALFAATGLLVTLVGAIQFLAATPAQDNRETRAKVHQVAQPKRSHIPRTSPDVTVPAGADIALPLSGSIASDPDFIAASPPSETIVKTEIDSDDDLVPLPPIDDVNEDPSLDMPAELRRIEQRLSELERRSAPDQATRSEIDVADDARFAGIVAQLQNHSEEMKTAVQRIERIEQRTAFATSEPISEQRITIRALDRAGESRWVIEARDANLPELLARLGEATGTNLVVAPEVTGVVSLHLSDLDSEAALEAVCRIYHCRATRNGNFVVISDEKVADQGQSTLPETISKLYRLKHLSGAEIRPYIQPLLTPGLGTCGFAVIRERVARTTYRHPPRAVLVKDTARVIAEVDRLIGELDRPPADGLNLPSPDKPLPARAPSEPSRLSELFDLPTTSENPVRSRE